MPSWRRDAASSTRSWATWRSAMPERLGTGLGGCHDFHTDERVTMRHFLNLQDVSVAEMKETLTESARLKADLQRGHRPPLLTGRVLGLVFEKPSLRTRASFEAAMGQLGGSSIFLGTSDGAMGQRESVADYARTLSGYCDAVVLRTFKHATIDESFVQEYRKLAPRGDLIVNGEPGHAVEQADVIYTDVWTSMGQEAEREERRRRFAGFQVNQSLLALAPAHARVMHCLPAVRGEEVEAEVLDGDRSIVFQQAANRMHAQKGLLTWLLKQGA